MMWMSHSAHRNDLTDLEIHLDTLEHLTAYAADTHNEIAGLRRLAERLPDAAANLTRLADALRRSKDYLQIKGAAASDDDVEKIAKVLEERGDGFVAMDKELEGDRSADVAAAAEEVRTALQQAAEAHAKCKSLVSSLRREKNREASLKFGTVPPLLTEVQVELPPEVPTPKLVDF